ncbi:unnamed protein product [Rotaria magnacalcarata]|uniref:UDP-D-xylose:beta-D-glucoside alpha-1,3-D-xylosyltransferase n=1 Tax=Rotaria magnacalcarata TaxID=392030 RepID=A0A8S2LDF2_9BILA|nr:unnamed protein product [Rotaria magnacalcarata]
MNFNSFILLILLNTEIYALKPIHLTLVVCGDRLEEALNALKSSLIFTPSPIIFHIFTEDHLREQFKEKINTEWPIEYKLKFQIEFYSIQFTRGNDERWRKLFKPCCTQRLFIPDILTNIDSVIYIDTDILFLSNVRSLWRFFRKFNSTQLAALTPEHEDPSMGWYNRFARHPYYGPMGLNSGVMLMNLTRMRQVNMISKIMNIFDEFHLNITWGDQCLLNIYFNYYPEQVYEFSCNWNYRPDHCMYENNCQMAKLDGIKIIHGCRSAFHNDKYQEFKSIYEVILNWNFNSNIKSSLLTKIQSNLKKYSLTNCGKTQELFTKHLSKEISSLNYSSKNLFHIALILNTSNVLLLHPARMKVLKINFEGVNNLSTENIFFLSCKHILDLDHCQSKEDMLFLPESINHSLYGFLYKIISRFDLTKSNHWNDSIENELSQIENIQYRNELIELFCNK